jgi:hypothetical protein
MGDEAVQPEVNQEDVGVKEILEVLEGLKEVGLLAKKAMADGKISISDFPLLMQLLTKHQMLNDAIKDIKLVPTEVKNLSGDEAALIVGKVYSIFSEIKNA